MRLMQRRAVSAVEVVLGLGLLLALAVPLYQMLTAGRAMGFRSRVAYMAVHAAREQIEDARVAAALAAPAELRALAHDWRPVAGPMMAALAPLARAADFAGLDYPAGYSRIFTRLEIGAPVAGGLHPATLIVRWQEKGEALGEAEAREREGTSRFDFLLGPAGAAR